MTFIELVRTTPDPHTRSLEVFDNWFLGVHLEVWSQETYNCDTTGYFGLKHTLTEGVSWV